MNAPNEFIALLASIYGEKLLLSKDSLVIYNNYALEFKSKNNLNLIFQKYVREREINEIRVHLKGETLKKLPFKNPQIVKRGCFDCRDNCKKNFNPPILPKKFYMHQDFPGWLNPLRFDNNGLIINKDIIIVGLEVASLKTIKEEAYEKVYGIFNKNPCINIWYQLGYYDKQDIINEMKNPSYKFLWRNIKYIFPNIEQLLKRIYGTDLAKCYTADEILEEVREYCPFKKTQKKDDYFIKELSYFKESMGEQKNRLKLIFQGKLWQGKHKPIYNFLSKQLNFIKEHRDNVLICRKNTNINFNYEYGTFTKGKYLIIPHSSPNNTAIWKQVEHLLTDLNLSPTELVWKESLEKALKKIRKYLQI